MYGAVAGASRPGARYHDIHYLIVIFDKVAEDGWLAVSSVSESIFVILWGGSASHFTFFTQRRRAVMSWGDLATDLSHIGLREFHKDAYDSA